MAQPITAAQLIEQAEKLTCLLASMNPQVSICESPAKAACRLEILQVTGYVLNGASPAETQVEIDRAAKLYGLAHRTR
ncbi:MAG: hypothetical protein CMK92_00275 [Pseudomonas sp.]|jgi:hypothetical protein|nr:hypothetical protein [Pseudomonas sp.]|tara:strand:- start:167 stop:400 length:234 start_codon:yes stop_codon:yes gene_type:complete